MVVIIDDRADVWEWSPNLVKVVPCTLFIQASSTTTLLMFTVVEFFVGIGDINSAFLPKQQPLAPVPPEGTPGAPAAPPASIVVPPTTASATSPLALPAATPPVPTEAELDEIAKEQNMAQNADDLAAQVEERPLAKMQEELQKAEDAEEEKEAQEAGATPEPEPVVNGDAKPVNGAVAAATPTPPPQHKHHRKALLRNTDRELMRVQRVSICACNGTHSH